jgi:hypothetical protein
MSDVWNGESRGCSDVMFSRIQILMRGNDLEGEYDDLYTSVISLVTYCEENDKRLTDILEKVYLELKEEANEVLRKEKLKGENNETNR